MLSTFGEKRSAKGSSVVSAMPRIFAMRNCEEAIEPIACQKQREKEKEREKEKKREISESLHPRPNLLSSSSWLYVAWNPGQYCQFELAVASKWLRAAISSAQWLQSCFRATFWAHNGFEMFSHGSTYNCLSFWVVTCPQLVNTLGHMILKTRPKVETPVQDAVLQNIWSWTSAWHKSLWYGLTLLSRKQVLHNLCPRIGFLVEQIVSNEPCKLEGH